jgi:ribosomal protein S6--L-glutamate ligase
VDMLEGKDGPKILEINSSPGLEGIERASGVDVAGAIITCAERYAERRRRRVGSGDVVIEDERRERRLRPNGSSLRSTNGKHTLLR